MNAAILKFGLTIEFEQTIEVSKGSQILTAQIQRDHLCVWVLVGSPDKTELKTIIILGTGHPVPKFNMRFIDTVQQGEFVWHVFEKQ